MSVGGIGSFIGSAIGEADLDFVNSIALIDVDGPTAATLTAVTGPTAVTLIDAISTSTDGTLIRQPLHDPLIW